MIFSDLIFSVRLLCVDWIKKTEKKRKTLKKTQID